MQDLGSQVQAGGACLECLRCLVLEGKGRGRKGRVPGSHGGLVCWSTGLGELGMGLDLECLEGYSPHVPGTRRESMHSWVD